MDFPASQVGSCIRIDDFQNTINVEFVRRGNPQSEEIREEFDALSLRRYSGARTQIDHLFNFQAHGIEWRCNGEVFDFYLAALPHAGVTGYWSQYEPVTVPCMGRPVTIRILGLLLSVMSLEFSHQSPGPARFRVEIEPIGVRGVGASAAHGEYNTQNEQHST
jgi:hypothetical protein